MLRPSLSVMTSGGFCVDHFAYVDDDAPLGEIEVGLLPDEGAVYEADEDRREEEDEERSRGDSVRGGAADELDVSAA